MTPNPPINLVSSPYPFATTLINPYQDPFKPSKALSPKANLKKSGWIFKG
jgi:hypothetical protein